MYRIKNWDKHYETAKSRDINKTSWIPIPNDQSNLKYIRLMGQKDGATYFGVFIALLQICSRQPKDIRDGYLTDDGTALGIPYGYHDISAITRIDTKVVQSALKSLVNDEIGWITEEKDTTGIPQGHHGTHEVSVEGKGTEGKGIEGKGTSKAEVVALFKSICPNLSQPRGLAGKRKIQLEARIKENPETIFWQDYFATVSKSAFLHGENDRSWKADFGWLIKPDNMNKVLEGNYTNHTPNNTISQAELTDMIRNGECERDDYKQAGEDSKGYRYVHA